MVGFGFLYLNQSITSNKQQLSDGQSQLKIAKIDETQKRVQDISNSLKLVVQVLGKEVLLSKLIQQIGAAMPSNTILTDLSITKVQGGIDLKAAAKDYQSATQVQVNLQDKANKIFDKADIVQIQCANASSDNAISGYPCTVTIRAQFAKQNPFLFINQSTVGTKSWRITDTSSSLW